MLQVYANIGNISNVTSIMAYIAMAWRYIEPEGPINDEHIQKLDGLVNDVFQACNVIQNKLSNNMETKNIPTDKESLEKFFNEVIYLTDKLNKEFNAFMKCYLDLSKTFLNRNTKSK